MAGTKFNFSIVLLMFSLLLSSVLFYDVASAELVPDWVKKTAKWYGDGITSETEFLNAIKFLIENNIIVIDFEDISTEGVSQESLTATVIIPQGNVGQTNIGSYIPLSLDIRPGTTVDWINEDIVGHTIQSQDGEGNVISLFNSNVLETGDIFSYKFEESGDYNYFCTLHPWRVGVINVN